MITEEMLKAAAAEADKAIQDSLPAPEACGHVFSRAIQKKIRRISARARHPVLYKLVRSAACVALVVLLIGSTWLTVDAAARTAFLSWVKETYTIFEAYHFAGEGAEGETAVEYSLPWIPEGYEEVERFSFDGCTTVCYANEAGEMLKFSFISNSSGAYWFIDKANTTEQVVDVGGVRADFYRSNSPDAASAIVWMSPDGSAAFYLSGFLSEEELIQMAEQVEVQGDGKR